MHQHENLLADFEALTARAHAAIVQFLEPHFQWLLLTHPVELEVAYIDGDDYSRITAIGKNPASGTICCWLEDNGSEFGPTVTLMDFTEFDFWPLLEVISRLESKEFTLVGKMSTQTEPYTGRELID